VLRATLPAGTVSGAPKVRAMEIIDELEPVKRGPYAGVVGYLDFSGNLDTAIAIRTMVIGRRRRRLGPGRCRHRRRQRPRDEDLECQNKAVALLAAIPAARRMTLEALEVLRIEAGRPRMGHELDASTIPAESGVVPISVSFTKGCYTGQELVARIESRGSHTPRRLVGLHLRDGSLPDLGSTLEHDGNVVGRVTSVSAASSLGHPIGLAYLARAVAVPAEVQVTTPEGPVAATAVQLPLLASGSV
jgi:folate-binding protein YgfZ